MYGPNRSTQFEWQSCHMASACVPAHLLLSAGATSSVRPGCSFSYPSGMSKRVARDRRYAACVQPHITVDPPEPGPRVLRVLAGKVHPPGGRPIRGAQRRTLINLLIAVRRPPNPTTPRPCRDCDAQPSISVGLHTSEPLVTTRHHPAASTTAPVTPIHPRPHRSPRNVPNGV
jgi:hypothetical protein